MFRISFVFITKYTDMLHLLNNLHYALIIFGTQYYRSFMQPTFQSAVLTKET